MQPTVQGELIVAPVRALVVLVQVAHQALEVAPSQAAAPSLEVVALAAVAALVALAVVTMTQAPASAQEVHKRHFQVKTSTCSGIFFNMSLHIISCSSKCNPEVLILFTGSVQTAVKYRPSNSM